VVDPCVLVRSAAAGKPVSNELALGMTIGRSPLDSRRGTLFAASFAAAAAKLQLNLNFIYLLLLYHLTD
jgi:hypothetical protein